MWKGQGFCNYIDKLARLWLPPHLQVSQSHPQTVYLALSISASGMSLCQKLSPFPHPPSQCLEEFSALCCLLIGCHDCSSSLRHHLCPRSWVWFPCSPHHENELDTLCLPAPILSHTDRMYMAYILKEKEILKRGSTKEDDQIEKSAQGQGDSRAFLS